MGLTVPNCNVEMLKNDLASLFVNFVVQYSTQTQLSITYLTGSTYHHKPMVVVPSIFEFFTSFHRQTFSMVEPADASVCCQSGISSNILSLAYLRTLTAVH